MPQNVHLISRLLCNALWVDADFAAIDEVSKCLWNIINNTLISQSYNVFCKFNRVDALTAEQKATGSSVLLYRFELPVLLLKLLRNLLQ